MRADASHSPCAARGVGVHVYRPQFFVRTADVTGSVKLPEGTEMVMPGDTVSLTINVSIVACLFVWAPKRPGLTLANAQQPQMPGWRGLQAFSREN